MMLGHRRTRGIAALVSIALVAATAPARAEPSSATKPAAAPPATAAPVKREPSAGDLATARSALREGLVLREKGELEEALMRLSTAYDLVQTPVTGFELGKAHLMLGHVLQAHELFKKVERMPPSMEESTRSQTAREEAVRLAKEIEPRIPSLRIKLTLPKDATAVVRVDDDVITTTGHETFRLVDPGPHEIVAKAGDGPEQKVHVEVAESETKEVDLAPRWVPPKDPPKDANAPQPIFIRVTNPLVYIGFGVAAATAVVSTVAAIAAVDAHEEARSRCGRDFCPPRSDTTLGNTGASVGDLNFTQSSNTAAGLALLSVAAGATSVLFATIGIIGLRRPVKERVVSSVAPPPGPALRPVVGLSGAGLVGTF
jgi:hypothetical protein